MVAAVDGDFASFLLGVLISNLLLYTLFYLLMKLRHGERILVQPIFYIVVSLVTWSGALYFFVTKSTSWVLSPAESRLVPQIDPSVKLYNHGEGPY